MIKVDVTKNKVALEDLLVGVGTEVQTRGNAPVTATKINMANLPYDGEHTLEEKVTLINQWYDYMLTMQPAIEAALALGTTLQALQPSIDELSTWLVNGNVLSPFQAYLQTVTGTHNLADNLNYLMLDTTVIDDGAIINLGTNTNLYLIVGTEV